MTINCGVCEKEIPSHMVERRRGSHYTEHYVNVEEILHKDLGKILKVRHTDELISTIEKIQKEKEPEIVRNAFNKVFVNYGIVGVYGDDSILRWCKSIEDVELLIKQLHNVINISTDNEISVDSVDKLGRHQKWDWNSNKLYVPHIDICADCFSKFNHPKVTLGYLDRAIPQLKLQELNKDIWNVVSICAVELELI